MKSEAENALPGYDKQEIEEPIGFFRTLFRLKDITTERAIPAVVVDYNKKNGTVTVLPMAKVEYDTRNGAVSEDRETVTVRVLKICQGGYSISLPIFKGDTGWLIAGDRKCGKAIEKNGEIVIRDLNEDELKDRSESPDDCSILNFSNGFFLPFSWELEDADKNPNGNYVIRNVRDQIGDKELENEFGVVRDDMNNDVPFTEEPNGKTHSLDGKYHGKYVWSMIELESSGIVNLYGQGKKFSVRKDGLYLDDKLIEFGKGGDGNFFYLLGNADGSERIDGDVSIESGENGDDGEIVAKTEIIEKGKDGNLDKSKLKLDLKLKRKKITLHNKSGEKVDEIEYYASEDLPLKVSTGLDISAEAEEIENGNERTVYYLKSLLEAALGIEITRNSSTNAWKIKNTGVIGLAAGKHIHIERTSGEGVFKIYADEYPEVPDVNDGILTVKYGNDSESEEDSDAKGFSNSDFTANTESNVTLKIPKPIRKKASEGDGTFGLDISHDANRNVVEFENTGLTGLRVQQSGQNRYAQITGGTDTTHDDVEVKTKDITLTIPIPQSIDAVAVDERNKLDAIAVKLESKGNAENLNAEEKVTLYIDKSKANTSIKTHDGSELGKVFGDGDDIILPQTQTIPDIEVDTTAITSGKAIGGLTVDATNKHKIIASAVDIPAALQGSDYIDIPTTGTDAGKVKAKVSPTTTDPHALVTTDTNQTISGTKTFSKTVQIKNPTGDAVARYFSVDNPNNQTRSILSAGNLYLDSDSGTENIYFRDYSNRAHLARIYFDLTRGQLVLSVFNDQGVAAPNKVKLNIVPEDETSSNSQTVPTMGWVNDKFLRIANLTAGTNVTITPDSTGKKLTISATQPTIPDITATESGSGNVVTGVTANGHALTITKGTVKEPSGSDYIDVSSTGVVSAKVPTDGSKGLVTTDTNQTIGGSKTFGTSIKIKYDSNGEGTYFPNAIYLKPKEGFTSWISFYDSVTGNNVIAQLYCNSSGRLRLISNENGVNVEVPDTPHIYLYDKKHTLFLADIFARYESADGVVHPLILKGDMYGSGTVAQLVIGHDATSGQPVFRISRMPDDSTDVSSRDLMTLGNANNRFLRIANLVAGSNITITPDTTNPKKLTIAAQQPDISGKADKATGLTGATKCKITYNSQGIVTAGADLEASDLPSHTHTKSEITDFPTALKNPNALTIKKSGSADIVYDGSAAKTITLEAGGATLDHSFLWEGTKKADIAASADIAIDSKTIQGSGGITVTEQNRVITISGSGSQVSGYTTPAGTFDYEVTGQEWDATNHRIVIHKVKKTYENGLLKTRVAVADEYIQFVEETV